MKSHAGGGSNTLSQSGSWPFGLLPVFRRSKSSPSVSHNAGCVVRPVLYCGNVSGHVSPARSEHIESIAYAFSPAAVTSHPDSMSNNVAQYGLIVCMVLPSE